MPYTLTVNGKPRTVDAPADMPLLWVLRDVLVFAATGKRVRTLPLTKTDLRPA